MKVFLESHNINNKAGGLGTFNFHLIKSLSNFVKSILCLKKRTVRTTKRSRVPDFPSARFMHTYADASGTWGTQKTVYANNQESGPTAITHVRWPLRSTPNLKTLFLRHLGLNLLLSLNLEIDGWVGTKTCDVRFSVRSRVIGTLRNTSSGFSQVSAGIWSMRSNSSNRPHLLL